LEEPPHIEEILDRLDKTRKKAKLMQKRGKNQKKNAMQKILGRNIQMEDSESKTDSKTDNLSPQKAKMAKGSNKLRDMIKINDDQAYTVAPESTEKNFKMGVMESGAFDLSSSEDPRSTFKNTIGGTTSKNSAIKERERLSSPFQGRNLLAESKKAPKKQNSNVKVVDEARAHFGDDIGDILGNNEFAVSEISDEPGQTPDIHFDDDDVLGGFEKTSEDPLNQTLGDLGLEGSSSNEGIDEQLNNLGLGIEGEQEDGVLLNGFDDVEFSSSNHRDQIIEDLLEDPLTVSEQENQVDSIRITAPAKGEIGEFETPVQKQSKQLSPTEPAQKKKRQPQPSTNDKKQTQDKQSKKGNTYNGKQNNVKSDQIGHPEAAEGYELIESHVLESMINQIQSMQNRISGLQKEKTVLSKQNEDNLRKTKILEKAAARARIEEDDAELAESHNFEASHPSVARQSSKQEKANTEELKSLKEDIANIKNLLQDSIINLNSQIKGSIAEKLSTLVNVTQQQAEELKKKEEEASKQKKAEEEKKIEEERLKKEAEDKLKQSPSEIISNLFKSAAQERNNEGSSVVGAIGKLIMGDNSDIQSLLRQNNSVMIMNKWLNTIVKEKQQISQQKLVLRNQKEKLERKKYMLKSHELEMASELQKMRVNRDHPLAIKIKKTLIGQLSSFKDDLNQWKLSATEIQIKQKNLEVIENTLASTNTLASLDGNSDKHLEEMYRTYLLVGKENRTNLFDLSASNLEDDDDVGYRVGGLIEELDFTTTVTLQNAPERPNNGQNIPDITITMPQEDKKTSPSKDIQSNLNAQIFPDELIQSQQISVDDKKISVSPSSLDPTQTFGTNTLTSQYGLNMMELTGPSIAMRNSRLSSQLNDLRRSYADQRKEDFQETYSSKLNGYFNTQAKWFNSMQQKVISSVISA